MGERKVLNKYFPPDFDPAKLPKGKRPDNNMMKVRMMLPMSIRCQTCGTYMYKGTKFNTRKEDVEGENYLGIQVFRFYFRCNTCAAEMTMKTDPEHADYTVEQGASRNYEPWRDKDRATAEAAAAREEEERGNAMKALENRTLDSKREMDIMNALDEMQSLKQRQERVDGGALLAALKRSAEEDGLEGGLDDDDEAAVKAMLMQQRGFVRRLEDGAPSSSSSAAAGAAGAGALRGAAPEAGAVPAAARAPDAAALPSSSRPGGPSAAVQAGTSAGAPAPAAAKPAPRPPAKRPPLPLLVRAKRKAPDLAAQNGGASAAAAEPPGKRRDAAEGTPLNGSGVTAQDDGGGATDGGGLGGLLGYGSGSGSE